MTRPLHMYTVLLSSAAYILWDLSGSILRHCNQPESSCLMPSTLKGSSVDVSPMDTSSTIAARAACRAWCAACCASAADASAVTAAFVESSAAVIDPPDFAAASARTAASAAASAATSAANTDLSTFRHAAPLMSEMANPSAEAASDVRSLGSTGPETEQKERQKALPPTSIKK